MKLIYDGIYDKSLNRLIKTMYNYVPESDVVISTPYIENFNTIRMFPARVRKNIYDIAYKDTLKEFKYNNDKYADVYQEGSIITCYVVERLIEHVKYSKNTDEIIPLGVKTSRAIKLLDEFIENTPEEAVVCIIAYPDILLRKTQDFVDPRYTLSNEEYGNVDEIRKYYSDMLGFDAMPLINTFYNEAYSYLEASKERKFKVHKLENTNLDSYADKIWNAAERVILPNRLTFAIDIDDVLVNYDHEKNLKLEYRDYDKEFKKDCRRYFYDGYFESNFQRLMKYMEDVMGKVTIPQANIVILTARNRKKDDSFLKFFTEELYSSLYVYTNKEDYLKFSGESDVLANPSDVYTGATFFKSYSIANLYSRICMDKRTKNGLVFIDDRIKYVKAALDTVSKIPDKLVKSGMAESIDPRNVGLKNVFFNDRIIYSLTSFKCTKETLS